MDDDNWVYDGDDMLKHQNTWENGFIDVTETSNVVEEKINHDQLNATLKELRDRIVMLEKRNALLGEYIAKVRPEVVAEARAWRKGKERVGV